MQKKRAITVQTQRHRHPRSPIFAWRWRSLSLLTIASLVLPLIAPIGSSALTPPAVGTNQALLVAQSNRFVVLPPGKSLTVWFDFKNTGTATWTNANPHPVGLNTDGPMRRTSMFQYRNWRAAWRPTRVQQTTVKPGEIGRFRFAIKAPNKPGIWIERFALVRDRETRIPGGDIELVIVVGKSGDPNVIYRAAPTTPLLSLWVKPGERVLRSLEFKNVGYATWRTAGFGTTSMVSNQTGVSASSLSVGLQSTPAIMKSAKRREKTTAMLDLVAPDKTGTFTTTIGLYGPPGVIAGSAVQILLTVSNEPEPPLAAEPAIRVGIFAPVLTKPVELTANGAYEIRSAETNTLLKTRNAGEVASLQYDPTKATYTLKTNTTITTKEPVRFMPKVSSTIMEVKTTALGSYNRFRGVLEAHYASATSKLWIINELPLENYLQGLGETGPTAPDEFVKTLITAARSYALYKILEGRRHDNENYKINSTTDQVYKGYNYETRTPNITAGVNSTRGLVVTHSSMVSDKNKVGTIVAAYSSCTDGRTRSYYERWGGNPDDFPYLLSVPDPNGICTDATLRAGGNGNHMVGMSAVGALNTWKKSGTPFDALLRYYYTNANITKAYL